MGNAAVGILASRTCRFAVCLQTTIASARVRNKCRFNKSDTPGHWQALNHADAEVIVRATRCLRALKTEDAAKKELVQYQQSWRAIVHLRMTGLVRGGRE